MLVHEKVADGFVERLVARTRAWTYGDPMDRKLDMGTVIDEGAAREFEAKVDDAVAVGRAPARRQRAQGRAVFAHGHRSREARDERRAHGDVRPRVPVIRFKDIDDAIRISNGTAYGLSSAVCTNRLDYITRFVSELQVGTVNVREVPGYRLELTPFGGIKDSGLGYKEGVQEAMKSFTNTKTYSLPW
jgi:aldehyde dehydrogenase (NAD+)